MIMKHIDYRGKCATCIHFQRNENPENRDGRCLKKRRSHGGLIGYSAGCKDWTLKLSTVCKRCGAFIEHWYNYCPVCGMPLPEPPKEVQG